MNSKRHLWKAKITINMKKSALVISGGGSKGAFAVGVLHELKKTCPNLNFDVIVGTSTGALIAPFAATGDLNLLKNIYTKTKNKDILVKYGIGRRLKEKKDSIYSVNPLRRLLDKNLTKTRYNKIINSGKELHILTTCLQTKRLAIFTTSNQVFDNSYYDTYKITDLEHMKEAVLASACQPVFMPTIRVNLNNNNTQDKRHQFVDGGVVEYAGIELAIDSNVDEVIGVVLSKEKSVSNNTEYDDIISVLKRTIDVFSNEVGQNDVRLPQLYNESLKYIDSVKRKLKRLGVSSSIIDQAFTIRGNKSPFENKKPIDIHLIRPLQELNGGPGGLDFIPNNMLSMFNQGGIDTGQYLASLTPIPNDWV